MYLRITADSVLTIKHSPPPLPAMVSFARFSFMMILGSPIIYDVMSGSAESPLDFPVMSPKALVLAKFRNLFSPKLSVKNPAEYLFNLSDSKVDDG
ncbi:hypothetical protein WICPIJ_001201 [Wickerhamomyces pijperi]|uniref:Uncharacterized protein n=1 Tax=Wickerhamomyces pijperi TaxID=599730 RepID=A0A9P8TQV2_WICPI|nr:hypothetical protein WICPIJ_001201 [Wickerhamomyces pijperi]